LRDRLILISVPRAIEAREAPQSDPGAKFVADSKTPTGVAEVPLTEIAVKAFFSHIEIAGPVTWLFPSLKSPTWIR
jgi:hypothetical protein